MLELDLQEDMQLHEHNDIGVHGIMIFNICHWYQYIAWKNVSV